MAIEYHAIEHINIYFSNEHTKKQPQNVTFWVEYFINWSLVYESSIDLIVAIHYYHCVNH